MKKTGKCVQCDVDEFKAEDDTCRACSVDTLTFGKKGQSRCDKCPRGEEIVIIVNTTLHRKCVPCPVDFYLRKGRCERCDEGMSTKKKQRHKNGVDSLMLVA